MSDIEEMLSLHIKTFNLPEPIREHKFHATRKWRFDFAWVDRKIAVEVEGGTFSGGRHVRGSGFEKDAEKYNQAAAEGWRVFRFTSGMIKRGEAINFLKGVVT